jgi:malate dehydrogenase (oxaloacetate-decarboxylating)(NADP+)
MPYTADALEYHALPHPGKLSVVPTKPCLTQRDLSLAYTPGVAVPCKAIEARPDDAYSYTNKGNLVAVVSNGTAVLGLGNIGALAGKPVMEGKGVLFKRFAGIDVFDIELNTDDPEEIIRICEVIAPTFGGINLEDIRAPDCFRVEEELKKKLDIPVFHDDQHGTAIISGAALLNALDISGKNIADIRVVFCGAGAAGIACSKFYEELGVPRWNITLCDSMGVIYAGREDVDPEHPRYNPHKAYFARSTNRRTLADALVDADTFAGVSVAGLLTQDMVRSMADRPFVCAMANPDPEIGYEEAKAARSDVIVATGRSDCPNQVNNVLGFPFIFRGALDVRARAINETMKIAAARSLAALAREDVPDTVLKAYGVSSLRFGEDYLIPKPFDPRVLTWEAIAVAKAAVESGVARMPILDWDEYRDRLEDYLGAERGVMRRLIHRAQREPMRIVFAEGEDPQVLRAAHIIVDEGIGKPVLLGRADEIARAQRDLDLPLDGCEVIDPSTSTALGELAVEYFQLRCRKGVMYEEAKRDMLTRSHFGPMMVRRGMAEVYISGQTRYFPSAIRPMLRVMSDRTGTRTVAAAHIAIQDGKYYVLADTSVNIEPTAEQLAAIAEGAHSLAVEIGLEPRIAMLSFSTFGSVQAPSCDKMRRAAELVRERHPSWCVDGEIQADIAVDPELLGRFTFSELHRPANCLIFPCLDAANIVFRLLRSLGGLTLIGPLLIGLDAPMHILQRGSSVDDIVNVASIGVVQAQRRQEAGRSVAPAVA